MSDYKLPRKNGSPGEQLKEVKSRQEEAGFQAISVSDTPCYMTQKHDHLWFLFSYFIEYRYGQHRKRHRHLLHRQVLSNNNGLIFTTVDITRRKGENIITLK
jgi:hypothetical protein